MYVLRLYLPFFRSRFTSRLFRHSVQDDWFLRVLTMHRALKLQRFLESSRPYANVGEQRCKSWCIFPFTLLTLLCVDAKSSFQNYCGNGVAGGVIRLRQLNHLQDMVFFSVTRGAYPVVYSPRTISPWSISWIIVNRINPRVDSTVLCMAKDHIPLVIESQERYILRSNSSILAAILVSFIGLVVTAAFRNVHDEDHWKPSDLLMRMMDSSRRNSVSRADELCLSPAYALTIAGSAHNR
ncbi:uncharacterized protein EV420DRAFT_812081 [Desarmillaria tabescens]|uniref:Uncharacterized protein n=1 Tax=Armillaria tabescens TaxID=1929756 RepID=A0AA39TPM0_ARMTA|nr:uncharacterized protein EV420DRAFT_812081 [Desarmillaria tabescens]KAK0466152.1 hypothetical protein EV420DRAFT_812081 [Desarmillaria tabescens]